MAKSSHVISHWGQLFEHFQASPQAFYDAFERAVESRAVPETRATRVEHKESGLASAQREYLRMHRGKQAFDICAAPFGNGFFVSWWLTEPPLQNGFLYTLGFFVVVLFCLGLTSMIGFAVGFGMGGFSMGIFLAFSLTYLGVPFLMWMVGSAIRNGNFGNESTVLAIPIVGWLYERIFAPETYYAMDTALMFQDAVHSAVLEVIDGMTAQKGMRALSDEQRKPIMKRFAATV